jgi:hypothetical protein
MYSKLDLYECIESIEHDVLFLFAMLFTHDFSRRFYFLLLEVIRSLFLSLFFCPLAITYRYFVFFFFLPLIRTIIYLIDVCRMIMIVLRFCIQHLFEKKRRNAYNTTTQFHSTKGFKLAFV